MNLRLLIPAAIFLLVVHSSTAQTGKGRKFVGASAHIGLSDNENRSDGTVTSETDGFALGFHPYFGLFIRDGLALGTGLNLYTRHEDRVSSDRFSDRSSFSMTNEHRVGASIFLKKMMVIKGRLGWYLQPELGYYATWTYSESESVRINSSNEEEVTERFTEKDAHDFNVRVQAGLYYFLADRWSIETNLLHVTLSYHTENSHLLDRNVASDYETRNLRLNSSLTNRFSLSRAFTVNYYF